MKHCYITITTTIDGQANVFSTKGKMQTDCLTATICYADEESSVTVSIADAGVEIRRVGGYHLRLLLQEGKTTKGEIGVSGSVGEIDVACSKLGFTIQEKSCMLLCDYNLCFGKEKQRTKIRLLAREEDED